MAAIKDHYIRALQYAESRSEFTLQELAEALSLSETQEKQLALQIHEKQLFQQSSSNFINSYKNDNINLHLSVEDRIKLLNYITLEEARSSSLSATRFAVIAIVISIASFISSALLSLKQISSDINIPESFTQKISETTKQQTESIINVSEANQALLAQSLSQIIEKQSETNNYLDVLLKTTKNNKEPSEPHAANDAPNL